MRSWKQIQIFSVFFIHPAFRKRSVLALIEGRRLFRRLYWCSLPDGKRLKIRFDGLFILLKYFRHRDSLLSLNDTIPVDSMFSEYDTFVSELPLLVHINIQGCKSAILGRHILKQVEYSKNKFSPNLEHLSPLVVRFSENIKFTSFRTNILDMVSPFQIIWDG